jgi:hypothetical protein
MPTDAVVKGIAPPSLSPRPAVFARYDPNAADLVFGQSGHRHSIFLVGSARVLAGFVTRKSRRGLTSAVQAPHPTLDLNIHWHHMRPTTRAHSDRMFVWSTYLMLREAAMGSKYLLGPGHGRVGRGLGPLRVCLSIA